MFSRGKGAGLSVTLETSTSWACAQERNQRAPSSGKSSSDAEAYLSSWLLLAGPYCKSANMSDESCTRNGNEVNHPGGRCIQDNYRGKVLYHDHNIPTTTVACLLFTHGGAVVRSCCPPSLYVNMDSI